MFLNNFHSPRHCPLWSFALTWRTVRASGRNTAIGRSAWPGRTARVALDEPSLDLIIHDWAEWPDTLRRDTVSRGHWACDYTQTLLANQVPRNKPKRKPDKTFAAPCMLEKANCILQPFPCSSSSLLACGLLLTFTSTALYLLTWDII